MYDTYDLLTMLYWILGMIIVLFIIDWVWLHPHQERRHTDRIIKQLFVEKKKKGSPNFSGRGIVFVLDPHNILPGLLLVVTLRKSMCRLPIMVYTKSGGELAENVGKLLQSQNVTIGGILECKEHQYKVQALIKSPYRETLLIEPSLLFFGNPEYLFADPHYTQTGALFWKDSKSSSVWDRRVYDWVRRLIPYRKGDNQILDKRSGSFQSGDLLLIDKATHMKTLEKLEILSAECCGVLEDKEYYWIAAELAKENYTFCPFYPGAIGELSLKTLCGHKLYLDPAGNLLAWSGSMFKDGDTVEVRDFTHFAIYDQDCEWRRDCLYNAEYRKLPEELRSMFNEYARIVHDISYQLSGKI